MIREKNKDFIELMLKKSEEKTEAEAKNPFDGVDVKEVENLTKEVMNKKK
ncbi:MAG: hypothetical protein Q8Q35_01610 [Nanoarchaeota archaeon]|nr:hypothetical protein [Nanoarchaeota archaeon]